MKELLEKILAGGAKELAGLELTGVVPIPTALINEAISETLKGGVNFDGKQPPPPPENVDINALLAYVKQAEVAAEDGTLTLRFAIKID